MFAYQIWPFFEKQNVWGEAQIPIIGEPNRLLKYCDLLTEY